MQADVAEIRVRDPGYIQPVFRGPPYGSVPPAGIESATLRRENDDRTTIRGNEWVRIGGERGEEAVA